MGTPASKYGFAAGPERDAFYSVLDNWANCYFRIYQQTEQILADFYRAFPPFQTGENGEGSAGSLPVPVEKIADWLGFEVRRKSLNTTRNANLGLVLGRLEKIDGLWVIFLEEPYNLTYEQERFAIANLLGQYYVGRNAENAECAEVRFPTDNSEIMAMVFTAFLLLPPRTFFKAADEYADIEKRPINQERMLMTLSKQAKVPYYYTVVCYEYLKVLASYARIGSFEISDMPLDSVSSEGLAADSQEHRQFHADPFSEIADDLAPEKFFY